MIDGKVIGIHTGFKRGNVVTEVLYQWILEVMRRQREKEEESILQEILREDSKMTMSEIASFRKETLELQQKVLQIQDMPEKKNKEDHIDRDFLDQTTQERSEQAIQFLLINR